MIVRKLLVILFLAFTASAYADVRLSQKLGVGVWRTADGKFAILKMGNEKWYLYNQECIMRNGNCFYKFYVPKMSGYLVMSESFLNFNKLNYSTPFE